jgi:hypothetical protein
VKYNALLIIKRSSWLFLWVQNLVFHFKGKNIDEKGMLGRIFGHKEEDVTGGRREGGSCIMSNFVACTLHQTLFRWSDQE